MMQIVKNGFAARFNVAYDEAKNALVACVDLYNDAGVKVKSFCLAKDLAPIEAEVKKRLDRWHEAAHAARVSGDGVPPFPLGIEAPPTWVPGAWNPMTAPEAPGAPLGGGRGSVHLGWGLPNPLSAIKKAAGAIVHKVGWKSLAGDVVKVLNNPKLVGVVPGLGASYAAVRGAANLLKSAEKGSQVAQAGLQAIRDKAAAGEAEAMRAMTVLTAIYKTAAKGVDVEAEAAAQEEEGAAEAEDEVSGIAEAIGFGFRAA